MIEGLGRTGTTPLHRLSADVKLAGLAIVATALFFVDRPGWLGVAALVALAGVRSTGRGFGTILRDLAVPMAVIAVLGLVDWVMVDAETALIVVPRLSALAFAAHAVTLTTTTAELTETFERALGPFERLGLIDAGRAALTLTLALRFVPLIVEEAGEIREAQAARGLGTHPLALIVPLVVRTLVRAQTVADAIDARGFPPEKNSTTSRKSLAPRPRSGDDSPHEHP